MSRLTELMRVVKQMDPQLGADLEAELQPLQRRLPFGLNFERHAPEAVELPGHRVRVGSKVRVLPPRGDLTRGDQRLWLVTSIVGGSAQLTLLDGGDEDSVSAPTSDLVLVSEFRDQVFPGLRPDPDGSAERGGNKPFQTVINGENFHALKLLTFTHAHSVDAIYIDPPYNTGARDWKYNNDYIEGDDLYRHSKWLAFMERRLRVAKELLKPENSVLIVTIDEKEYLRLGLLLGQVFDTARIQMISSMINPKGVSRTDAFRRSDEYIFFVMLGAAGPQRLELGPEWSAGGRAGTAAPTGGEPAWGSMMRRGSNSARSDRPSLFYPIYVAPETKQIVHVGEPLDPDAHEAPTWGQAVATLPLRKNGSEGRWQISAAELRARVEQGRVRVGRPTAYGFVINYLSDGAWAEVQSDHFEITGYAEDGSVLARRVTGGEGRGQVPFTQWRTPSHNASEYGSTLLGSFLPGNKFPFPKSLYAVEDALRFFLSDKPNATVVDFFAGSGTTAHAVMRLNRQDDGSRAAILITNNEVSADEQRELRARGLRPADPEWEQHGICEAITKPRVAAAITGLTAGGQPIKGDYTYNDVFPIADGFPENAAFFTLTYESPWRVSTDRAFAAIAPMLWLRAGSAGRRIDEAVNGWELADTYGIVKDLDRAAEFVDAVRSASSIRVAYIVTDDEGRYQQIADELPGVETVRLYEDYLRNCQSNVGD